MQTYRIHFRLKNGYESSRYIPSFSKEEAEEEFRWAIRLVYDEEPEIIWVEELPRNGEAISNDKS